MKRYSIEEAFAWTQAQQIGTTYLTKLIENGKVQNQPDQRREASNKQTASKAVSKNQEGRR